MHEHATTRRKPGPAARAIEDRFWEKVDKRAPDECWPWIAALQPNGYGRFAIRREVMRFAHRIAYELTYGTIPNGLHVLHRCDNPPCCNPGHLYAGTDADNHRDMRERRRTRYGERNHFARLTAQEVIVIRELRASGMTQQAIANRFGVGRSTIQSVVTRKHWSHL